MTALTVGLAVGVPSAIIITFVALLWLRNQQKQNREADTHDDIDMDLRGNESFDHFENELLKPYGNIASEATHPDPPTPSSINNSHTTNTNTNSEKPNVSSNGSSASTNTIEHKKQGQNLPQTHLFTQARNPKPSSAYDFYDSFIPVLPTNGTSSAHDVSQLAPPPILHDTASTTASSNNSIAPSPQDKSLDSLAKQLTAPTFFEKLPSRAAPVVLKNRGNPSYASTTNNSSSDLVANKMVNDTSAINEHFFYEASGVDTKPRKRLEEVSTVDIDNSFDPESDIVRNDLSPFNDDRRNSSDGSVPGVIFR